MVGLGVGQGSPRQESGVATRTKYATTQQNDVIIVNIH